MRLSLGLAARLPNVANLAGSLCAAMAVTQVESSSVDDGGVSTAGAAVVTISGDGDGVASAGGGDGTATAV